MNDSRIPDYAGLKFMAVRRIAMAKGIESTRDMLNLYLRKLTGKNPRTYYSDTDVRPGTRPNGNRNSFRRSAKKCRRVKCQVWPTLLCTVAPSSMLRT